MNDTLLAPTPGSPGPSPGTPSSDSPSPHAPSNGVRTAWLVVGSLFALGVLAFATFSVVDVLAHGRSTEVTTHDGVRAVVVESSVGTVNVRADDVAVVTVSARISEGLRATGVTRVVDGDELVLRSTCPNLGGTWCSVDWDVVVPLGTDLVVRSDDDRADAAGEFGVVDMRSEHEGVTFDGTAESVVAESEHGDVAVRLGAAPDSVRTVSEHGDVSVAVPDIDDGYRIAVASNHGRTEVGVRSDPNADRSIEARSEHGNVTVAPTPLSRRHPPRR
jgi:hypothetical protein